MTVAAIDLRDPSLRSGWQQERSGGQQELGWGKRWGGANNGGAAKDRLRQRWSWMGKV